MSEYTVVQQGRTVSAGSDIVISLRQSCDWMRVYNYTQASTTTSGVGVIFDWFRGMADNDGFVHYHGAASTVTNFQTSAGLTVGGFTLQDTSEDPSSTLNTTVTAVSAAAIPIVSLTSTTGLQNFDIVRFINVTGGQQLGGIDFSIDTVIANTSFRLPYMAQIVAATTGSFRLIKFKPGFYPSTRSISKVTKASSAVITLTVDHDYVTGQQVRFVVPSEYGMTELDGKNATITAVNTTNNTITVDLDTTAYTTFAFPLTAAVPFTPAQVVPFGREADSTYNNSSADSLDNIYQIQMVLASGTQSPAGQASDVLYWQAGKGASYESITL